ncbi:MAG: PEGA domain-containing protein [Polyangiaceae bacterium]
MSLRKSVLSAAVVASTLLISGSAWAQPAKGTPAPGTPAPGTPAPGQPAKPGTPAPGTPAPGQPAKPAPPPKPLTEKEKKDKAREAFTAGQAKFDAGDFKGAYEDFKTADDLVPGAVPKYKMALCLDRANDVTGAVAAYQAFIDANAAAPDEKLKAKVDEVNKRLTELKATPAEVTVHVTPETAALSVDGTAQPGPVLKVPPGKHTIGATAPDFLDGKTDVEVTYAEKKEVTITLAEKPKVATPETPKPVEPKEPPKKGSKIPAIITLSLAGAGAVVGAVFGGLALKSKGEFEDTPTQDLYDETTRNALISDMSFGVAITFGVTGVVLLVTSNSASKDEKAEEKKSEGPHVWAAPWASPTGAGAVGVVTF